MVIIMIGKQKNGNEFKEYEQQEKRLLFQKYKQKSHDLFLPGSTIIDQIQNN